MANSWFDYDEYLKVKHLKGKRHTLTIRSAGEVKTQERGKEKTKPVLYFSETKKYLFMDSSTRREQLSQLYGDSIKECIGKKISVAPGKAQNGKDTIDILAPEGNGAAVVDLSAEHEQPVSDEVESAE